MKWTATFDEEGKTLTEVIDREGQDCSTIERVTNAIATSKELSHEHTGPDCDRVNEVQGG